MRPLRVVVLEHALGGSSGRLLAVRWSSGRRGFLVACKEIDHNRAPGRGSSAPPAGGVAAVWAKGLGNGWSAATAKSPS